jgi:hypothetical protein
VAVAIYMLYTLYIIHDACMMCNAQQCTHPVGGQVCSLPPTHDKFQTISFFKLPTAKGSSVTPSPPKSYNRHFFS